MSKTKKPSVNQTLDALPANELLKVKDILEEINSIFTAENEMLQRYMSKYNVKPKNDHYKKTNLEKEVMMRCLLDKILHKLNPKHKVFDRFLCSGGAYTFHRDLRNNIVEEELKSSSARLKDLHNEVAVTNKTYMKQVLIYENKLKTMENLLNELDQQADTFKDPNKLAQWILKQLKHSEIRAVNITNEISDYEYYMKKVSEEKEKSKARAVVKPINLLADQNHVDLTDQKCQVLLRKMTKCMEDRLYRKKARVDANQEVLNHKLKERNDEQELERLNKRLNNLENKIILKTNKIKKLENKRELEKENKDMVSEDMIDFCAVLAQKEEIRKNDKIIQCLTRKLNRKKMLGNVKNSLPNKNET